MRLARLILLSALLALPARAQTPSGPIEHRAVVSLVESTASVLSGGKGKSRALKRNDFVREADIVSTGPQGRLELTLPNGSVIRLGPSSRLELKDAYFAEGEPPRFRFKLFFGKIWSKVNSLVGSEARFEVETDNAVAGVRGTTFRVDAKKDRSVLLRVYAGAIAMRSAAVVTPEHQPNQRERVPGPNSVTKEAWERLVGAQMQLHVTAAGVPDEPKPFAASDDDAWARWNLQRDGQ